MKSEIQHSAASPTGSTLNIDELNAPALKYFIFTPVSKSMISYLASAAYRVIQCDPQMVPPPPGAARENSMLPPWTPVVSAGCAELPTLEDFITHIVVSSNVQTPTLMSTLVYLNRLRSCLPPTANGMRCSSHRIFLASLILAAKYLNDSSPKNKHWAKYSRMASGGFYFGFSQAEVNLMERQLLHMLECDLQITEEDLYRELDPFLAPLRFHVAVGHERRVRRRAAQQAAVAAKDGGS